MGNRVSASGHENRLHSTSALSSGIASTLVMTLVMVHPLLTRIPKVDILRILGKLFTPLDAVALLLGSILHLVAGAVFAWSYAWLWSKRVGKVSLAWGAIFGAVHGLLASVGMRYLLRSHPRRPQAWGLSNAVVYITAHIVFGTLTAGLYKHRS